MSYTYVIYKLFFIKGFKELPANGVLLMYVSADGCFQTSKHVNDCK